MSETNPPRGDALLVVSDPELGQTLRSEFEMGGWRTVLTNSAAPVPKLLQRGNVELLVLDEKSLSGAVGTVGNHIRSHPDELLLLVFLSLEGQKDLSLLQGLDPQAILDLPPNPEQIRQALHQIEQIERKKQIRQDSRILGRSEAVRQIQETIDQIAPTPVSVLITGESGTGKSLIAEAIHNQSPRNHARFLTVNCGAIPESLLESELFGHEKGAFTDARAQRQGVFEAADEGTVFLDEIGEMSLSAQVRLLRVLDAREVTRLGNTQPIKVDVRVIAATNRDLKKAVENSKFRRDLYYRLKVVEIQVPPLRSHPEDIPVLVEHFVGLYSREHSVPRIQMDAQAMSVLRKYRWPGNVRELKNLVERLMVLSESRQIGTAEIVAHMEGIDEPETLRNEVPHLPVRLGKTPEESHRDLLYWAILEVARDIKELKAYLIDNRSDFRSLPVYPSEEVPYTEQGTEVEYTETEAHPEEIKPLREVEKEAIARALKATGGHRKRAAKLLDMAERTLYRKIQQYNL